MVSVNIIEGSVRSTKPMFEMAAKKAAVTAATIAGVSGLKVLSGASGGPSYQFDEVPPIGIDIKDYHDSVVDNNVFEITMGTFHRTADYLHIPEKVSDVKESISDHLDNIREHLENWGSEVIEVLSNTL